jgi:hypothetical protein
MRAWRPVGGGRNRAMIARLEKFSGLYAQAAREAYLGLPRQDVSPMDSLSPLAKAAPGPMHRCTDARMHGCAARSGKDWRSRRNGWMRSRYLPLAVSARHFQRALDASASDGSLPGKATKSGRRQVPRSRCRTSWSGNEATAGRLSLVKAYLSLITFMTYQAFQRVYQRMLLPALSRTVKPFITVLEKGY